MFSYTGKDNEAQTTLRGTDGLLYRSMVPSRIRNLDGMDMSPNIFDGLFYLMILTFILLMLRAKFRRK